MFTYTNIFPYDIFQSTPSQPYIYIDFYLLWSNANTVTTKLLCHTANNLFQEIVHL